MDIPYVLLIVLCTAVFSYIFGLSQGAELATYTSHALVPR